MSERHAFLIIAHNNKEQLITLLRQIDNPQNDIYLHIDRKVQLATDQELESILLYSKIEILRDIRVAWGAFSLVECQLVLLKHATSRKHLFYHLLSGVDCITKKMSDFHDFFSVNRGKEFVHFQDKVVDAHTYDRVKYYHWLQEYTNVSSFAFVNKFIRSIEKLLILLQRAFQVNRWPEDVQLQKGANWFSITDDFANYLISQENWIKDKFSYTFIGDELFIQTLMINSGYYKNLYLPSFDDDYKQCVRYIDWNRGQPYVFDLGDEKELLASDMMFARKCTMDLVLSIISMMEG